MNKIARMRIDCPGEIIRVGFSPALRLLALNKTFYLRKISYTKGPNDTF